MVDRDPEARSNATFFCGVLLQHAGLAGIPYPPKQILYLRFACTHFPLPRRCLQRKAEPIKRLEKEPITLSLSSVHLSTVDLSNHRYLFEQCNIHRMLSIRVGHRFVLVHNVGKRSSSGHPSRSQACSGWLSRHATTSSRQKGSKTRFQASALLRTRKDSLRTPASKRRRSTNEFWLDERLASKLSTHPANLFRLQRLLEMIQLGIAHSMDVDNAKRVEKTSFLYFIGRSLHIDRDLCGTRRHGEPQSKQQQCQLRKRDPHASTNAHQRPSNNSSHSPQAALIDQVISSNQQSRSFGGQDILYILFSVEPPLSPFYKMCLARLSCSSLGNEATISSREVLLCCTSCLMMVTISDFISSSTLVEWSALAKTLTIIVR